MEGITKTWTDAVSASGHRATRWRVRTARRFRHQPILSIAEPTRAPHRRHRTVRRCLTRSETQEREECEE